MTLTLNSNGCHTNTTLYNDLKDALDSGYRALQRTLKEMRAIDVYAGKVNLTWVKLYEIGKELLAELKSGSEMDQAENEQRRDALLIENDAAEDLALAELSATEQINPTIKKWLENKHRGSIVMVAEPWTPGDTKHYYVTYGSHARHLARSIEREIVQHEFGFTKVCISAQYTWWTMNQLRRRGIHLILVD